MKLGIYSIQDVKSVYIGLTTGYGDDDAVRSFIFALRQNPIWCQNRGDYRLVRLGEFDSENGIITVLPSPRYLLDGAQVSERSINNGKVEE